MALIALLRLAPSGIPAPSLMTGAAAISVSGRETGEEQEESAAARVLSAHGKEIFFG